MLQQVVFCGQLEHPVTSEHWCEHTKHSD